MVCYGMIDQLQRHPTFVSKPAEIRVLASAIRQDVLETLDAAGPCTIRDLAGYLNRRVDALYYHVRVLERAGFVTVDRSDTQAVVVSQKRAIQLRYDPSNRENRAAVIAVVRAMLRGSQRGFIRAFKPTIAVVEGRARNLWAGRVKAWLTVDEMAAVNELLKELLSILQEQRDPQGDYPNSSKPALHEFAFVFNPVVVR